MSLRATPQLYSAACEFIWSCQASWYLSHAYDNHCSMENRERPMLPGYLRAAAKIAIKASFCPKPAKSHCRMEDFLYLL